MANPYLPSWEYVPDGEPHVFGDRLYVFGSHDRFNGKEYCENDYVCWSASINDLQNWRKEGVIYKRLQDPNCKGKQNHLYAPDVAQGPDGRFYLYYGLDFKNRIAIAVCDTPAGKYEYYGEVEYPDGVRYGGREKEIFRFDPAVLVDDDGKIYLYTGFSPKIPWFQTVAKRESMTINALGNYVVQLEPDMKTIKGEPKNLIPGVDNSKGTGFEGHEFYEASSIRKFDGKYYFIYSSFLSHELAYAVSDSPDKDFVYQGPLHSNGNIGFKGNQEVEFYWGNNHGSIERINGNYYVFGHRQTHWNECSRQGVAEPIEMDEDGRFHMAEMTSSGMDEVLCCGKSYEAGIACVLQEGNGACKITDGTIFQRKRRIRITQSGVDRESNPAQYVANVKNNAVIGYKYFDFEKVDAVSVTVRGIAKGELLVYANLEKTPIGKIRIRPTLCVREFTTKVFVSNGKSALYFRYKGIGRFSIISICVEKQKV